MTEHTLGRLKLDIRVGSVAVYPEDMFDHPNPCFSGHEDDFIYFKSGERKGSSWELDEKFIDIARFIVTACNCHADLLEALKDLVTDYEEIGGDDIYDDSYKQAKQAIREAEEQS